MNDLDERLRRDGLTWRHVFDSATADHEVPGLVRAQPTHRMRAHLNAFIAAAVTVGLITSVALFALARQDRSSSASTHRASSPSCSLPGPVFAPLRNHNALRHTASDALHAARVILTEHDHVTSVDALLVTDPLSAKVGLPDTPQPMWVISIDLVVVVPPSVDPSGHDPARRTTPYPIGSVLHMIALVDDATLRLGGYFQCNPPTPPQPH